jgi:hypothetical protein
VPPVVAVDDGQLLTADLLGRDLLACPPAMAGPL